MTHQELSEKIDMTADELNELASKIIKSLTSYESPKNAISLARQIQAKAVEIRAQAEEVLEVVGNE